MDTRSFRVLHRYSRALFSAHLLTINEKPADGRKIRKIIPRKERPTELVPDKPNPGPITVRWVGLFEDRYELVGEDVPVEKTDGKRTRVIPQSIPSANRIAIRELINIQPSLFLPSLSLPQEHYVRRPG